MKAPIIEVQGISKRYRLGAVGATSLREEAAACWQRLRGRQPKADQADFWALRDVSFTVQPGEVLGIIGRNGAGKSTLLKILARITEPTSGRAVLRGRSASLLEVGTGFHPDLSGRDNVFLNGAILGMKRAEILRKFDEIVAFAEVEKFIDTPVKRYSSGMYVRLAFAVAAHLEPEILVVDEVLAVGDASFQQKCMGKIEEVSGASGRTVIFVSHNMAAIQHLCKTVVLLNQGRLQMMGSPADAAGEYLGEARVANEVDLREWKDRRGSGEGRLQRLATNDDRGVRTNIFHVGDTIRFILNAHFSQSMVDPIFGVVVHGPTGEPLLDLQSVHGGLRTGRVSGDIVIEGKLENIGLYPGRYYLSPWIVDGGGQGSIDLVNLCCQIQIEPSPGRFGDLRLDPLWGKVYVPSAWRTCV